MEERRFDDLTRMFGRATSRRQVLKGLVGAVMGGAFASVGRHAKLPLAAAATPVCNGVAYDPSTQCCEPAGIQPRHPIANLDLCPNRVPHPGHVPSFNGCGPENGFAKYLIPNRIGPLRNVNFTQACNNHDICYDTCNSDKSVCDANFFNDLSAACAAAYPGNSWYQSYMRTVCINVDARIYYLAVSQTPTGREAYADAQKGACDCCPVCENCDGPSDKCCNDLCVDVSSDPANCGDCGKVCADKQICSNGVCQCPDITCPPNQTLDPNTCECAGDGGGTGGCPPCQSLGDNGCEPDPTMDGRMCGSCGKCSGGTCVPDLTHTCPTCSECQAGGNCAPVADNTSCGDNEVCCQGTCTSGSTCGPCPSGEHQCPPDVFNNQTCCADGYDCCAADNGEAVCGPTNGVCCPVGTTFQCDQECCDAASETCGYAKDGTGHCCPQGEGVVDDGTCCPNDQFCIMSDGSHICCPSGQQCASDPEQTVSICCDSPYADSDGNCCAANFGYATCVDGSYICCDPSQSDAVCCANHGGAR